MSYHVILMQPQKAEQLGRHEMQWHLELKGVCDAVSHALSQHCNLLHENATHAEQQDLTLH